MKLRQPVKTDYGYQGNRITINVKRNTRERWCYTVTIEDLSSPICRTIFGEVDKTRFPTEASVLSHAQTQAEEHLAKAKPNGESSSSSSLV